MKVFAIPVSPGSPLNAISVCLFSCLVLSSLALRMDAPRIAALEAATMQKSFPVIPSKTSLHGHLSEDPCVAELPYLHFAFVVWARLNEQETRRRQVKLSRGSSR